MNNKTPAVVLLSGGIDSTVLLHNLVKNLAFGPIHTLSFQYGQRHGRELECAEWQANAIKAGSHKIIELDFLGDLLKGHSALVSGGKEVPALSELSEEAKAQPPTYVPNRNMILLSLAAAYGEGLRIPDVYYGAQATDSYGYWDCTAVFLERLNHVFGLNRDEPIQIHAPFIRMAKSEIVRLGHELSVDFARTWTCYRGGQKACGECPSCVERLKAFDEAGVEDPLPYERKAKA
ncbi:MAG: 7-cyano-7-deazaguanine synthase QueC [Candidatus Hydrogenedentota bacterium]